MLSSPLWCDCRDVYSICVAFPDPLADRLYVETKSFLENYVKSQLDDFHYYMNEINDGENSNQLLNKYYCSWQNYSKGLQYLNYLYQYVAVLCPFFVLTFSRISHCNDDFFRLFLDI